MPLNVLCAYLTPGLLQLQLVEVGGTRGRGKREGVERVGGVGGRHVDGRHVHSCQRVLIKDQWCGRGPWGAGPISKGGT